MRVDYLSRLFRLDSYERSIYAMIILLSTLSPLAYLRAVFDFSSSVSIYWKKGRQTDRVV